MGGCGQGLGGLASEVGPITAREVGEGKERFPDIGGTVVESGRQGGLGVGDIGAVVEHKAGAAAAEVGGVEVAEALAGFGGGCAACG